VRFHIRKNKIEYGGVLFTIKKQPKTTKMQNANTKHRHSFKELKRMLDADKLSLNYLLHNVSYKEWHTFVTGMHDNVQKHFPDGTMLSKKQLKILRANLFIVRCSDKEKIHYHSKFDCQEYCPACVAHRKRNSLMKTFAVTNDMQCECAICMETGGNFAQLDCKHKFHTDCISTWLVQSVTCPCCRTNLDSVIKATI